MRYEKERQQICDIAKLMWERKLTNSAGGNIAVRVEENVVLMTPSLMSEEKHCRLKPEDILVVDLDLNKIEGEGKITREADMHVGVFKALPTAKACIHAHPKEAMVFACLGVPLPSLCEATDKFGTIEVLPFAKACTPELANLVVDYFSKRKAEFDQHGLAVFLRKHGIMVVEKSLNKAFDSLERIETNAYVNLLAKILQR